MMPRCTARLLRLLRLQSAASVPTGADDWYANIVWAGGRKCLLVAHARTMCCAFAADVRVGELRPLGRYVVTLIERELQAEGLAQDRLGPLGWSGLVLARTAGRRVLGDMNDFAFQAEFAINDAGGLGICDVATLNRYLRRIPFGRGGGFTNTAELLSAHALSVRGPLQRFANRCLSVAGLVWPATGAQLWASGQIQPRARPEGHVSQIAERARIHVPDISSILWREGQSPRPYEKVPVRTG